MEALLETFELDVDCDDCTFKGTVEAWEDKATKMWGWTCPDCGWMHDDSVNPADDFEYDNINEYWIDNE